MTFLTRFDTFLNQRDRIPHLNLQIALHFDKTQKDANQKKRKKILIRHVAISNVELKKTRRWLKSGSYRYTWAYL